MSGDRVKVVSEYSGQSQIRGSEIVGAPFARDAGDISDYIIPDSIPNHPPAQMFNRLVIKQEDSPVTPSVNEVFPTEELLSCVTCVYGLGTTKKLLRHLKTEHGKDRRIKIMPKTRRDSHHLDDTSFGGRVDSHQLLSNNTRNWNCSINTTPSKRRRTNNQIPSACTSQSTEDAADKDFHKDHPYSEKSQPSGQQKKAEKTATSPQRFRVKEQYECELCPYTSTVAEALFKHSEDHRTGCHTSLKISCKVCGKDHATQGESDTHFQKSHCCEERYLCDLCTYSGIQLKKLIQHRRIHTGEKPHSCPYCGFTVARRDNLHSHMRRMHFKDYISSPSSTSIVQDAAPL